MFIVAFLAFLLGWVAGMATDAAARWYQRKDTHDGFGR